MFWYNATRGNHDFSPYELMFHAKPRLPGVRSERNRNCPNTQYGNHVADQDLDFNDANQNPFTVGEQVFLRSSGRCDDPWTGPHRITSVKSRVGVEINDDGVTRHVSHMRRIPCVATVDVPSVMHSDSDSSDSEDDQNPQECVEPIDAVLPLNPTSNRVLRERRRPVYLRDYETEL